MQVEAQPEAASRIVDGGTITGLYGGLKDRQIGNGRIAENFTHPTV